MGSANSCAWRIEAAVTSKRDKDIPNLTKHQVILVQRTWNKLQRDMMGTGMKFFTQVFEKHPHLRFHFEYKVPEEKLQRNLRFRSHACRFMQAIGTTVRDIEVIHKQDEHVSRFLFRKGQMHAHMRGFQKEDFVAFQDIMNHVWEEELGHEYNESVREAWKLVFTHILKKVMDGYTAEMNKTTKK